MSAPAVSVIIPTFRRPDGLRLAVRSVFAQTFQQPFELIIVDNDPAGSAKDCAETLLKSLPSNIALQYIHEPNPGVANARNTAIAAVNSLYVAFLDDDQSAPPEWLQKLMDCAMAFPAAVTFGPVEAVLPDSVTHHVDYLKRFFSRNFKSRTGYIERVFGCGNALLALHLVPKARPMFDTAMNETGGEDDMLFSRVRRANGAFAWCAEAPVFEHVPENRANLTYTLRRAMAYGQGPVTLVRKQEKPNWLMVGVWMGVGVYKSTVNFAIYCFKWLLGAQDRAEYLDRAARGIGKIIWWRQFRFYGASRLRSAPDISKAVPESN